METDVTSEKRGKARKAKYMTDEKRVKNKNMYSWKAGLKQYLVISVMREES